MASEQANLAALLHAVNDLRVVRTLAAHRIVSHLSLEYPTDSTSHRALCQCQWQEIMVCARISHIITPTMLDF